MSYQRGHENRGKDVQEHPKRRPPVEKTLRLSNIRTPRLGRMRGGKRKKQRQRPQQEDPDAEEEKTVIDKEDDYAFEAREFVRKLLVGRKVWFEIFYRHNVSQRDFGDIFLYSESEIKRRTKLIKSQQNKNQQSAPQQHNYEDSLSYHLLRNGFATIMNRNKSPQVLVDASLHAEKNKLGKFSDQKYNKRSITFDADPKMLFQKYYHKKNNKDVNKGWIPIIVEYVINGHLLKVMFPDFEYGIVQLTGVKCPTNHDKKLFREAKHFTEKKVLHKQNIFLKIDGFYAKYNNLLVTFKIGNKKFHKSILSSSSKQQQQPQPQPQKEEKVKEEEEEGEGEIKKEEEEKKEESQEEKQKEEEEKSNLQKAFEDETFQNTILQVEILKKGFGDFLEFFEVIEISDFPLYNLFLYSEVYAKKHQIRNFQNYFFSKHFDMSTISYSNKRVIKNIKILEILSGDCLRILYSTKKQKYNEEIFFLSSIRCNKNLYFYETVELLRKELIKYNKEGLYLKIDYLKNNKKFISLYSQKTHQNVILNLLRKGGYFFLVFLRYDQKRSDEFLEYFSIFKMNKNYKKKGYFSKSVTELGPNTNYNNLEEPIGKKILNFERLDFKAKKEKILKENFQFLKSVITSPSEFIVSKQHQHHHHKGGGNKSMSGNKRLEGIILKVYYGNYFKIFLYKKNMIIRFHLKSLFCFKCKSSFYPIFNENNNNDDEESEEEEEESSSSEEEEEVSDVKESEEEDVPKKKTKKKKKKKSNKKKIKKKKKKKELELIDLKKPFGFEARRFSEDHLLFKKVNVQIFDYDLKQCSYIGQIYFNKKNYMEHCLKTGTFFLNRKYLNSMEMRNYMYFSNIEKKVQKSRLNIWKLNYSYNQLLNLFFNGNINISNYGGNTMNNNNNNNNMNQEERLKVEEDEEEDEYNAETSADNNERRGRRGRRDQQQQQQQQDDDQQQQQDVYNIRVIKAEPKCCKITHILNINHFFIQTSDSRKQLIRIEKELKTFDLDNKEPFNPADEEEEKELKRKQQNKNVNNNNNSSGISNNKSNIMNRIKGKKIFCKYYGDDHWYRGIILNQINKNNFNVFYPDYGNTEIVHVKNIRKYIHPSGGKQIPYQSKEVYLAFCNINKEYRSQQQDKQHQDDNFKKEGVRRMGKVSRNKEFWAILQYKNKFNKMFVSLKHKNSKQDVAKIFLRENWLVVDKNFEKNKEFETEIKDLLN